VPPEYISRNYAKADCDKAAKYGGGQHSLRVYQEKGVNSLVNILKVSSSMVIEQRSMTEVL
jgi:hypothetical protein